MDDGCRQMPTVRHSPLTTHHSPLKYAVAVWVIALLLIAVRVVAGPRVRTVFPIYAHAGENWVAGTDLYGFTPGIDVFRYSPGVAVLFVPWQWLPLGVGGALWRLVNAGVFFGALAWWARAAAPRPYAARRFAALPPLVAPIAGGGMDNGPVKRRRPRPVGRG